MSTFQGAYHRSLARAARAAMNDVIGVKKGERVLIITNPPKEIREISMSLFDASLERGAVPVLLVQREKGQFDLAEEEVVKSIGTAPDVVISISHDRLGKDSHGLKHGYKGKKRRYESMYDLLFYEGMIRTFWSPGITVDMFKRTVPIDYTRLRSDAKRICKIVTGSEKVRVTAPGGTDFTIGVRGREAKADDGDYRKPGKGGNVPSGEVYVCPALGTANGVIAFDGSIVLNEGEVVIRRPIVADVKDGFVARISGGSEADRLEESVKMGEAKARQMGRSGDLRPSLVKKYAKNAWAIGELGIGLNRKAKIVANMLEDEKVYGTCHFAIGSNYDGDAEAMIHLDGLVKSPTMTAISGSGKKNELMTDGRLAWD
jgi:aminopeptidase